MCAAPIRFEEIAYNYGFIPAEPEKSRSYCLVYRLFKECLEEDPRVVLVKGNEDVIQIKDIRGSLGDREKFIVYSQDIIDYYPFNLGSKGVGFLIEAKKRSKTGYWFIVFRREGQLAAFCSFLYWLINGKIVRSGRSLSPHRQPPDRKSTPPRRRQRKPRQVSWPRSQRYSIYIDQSNSGYGGDEGRLGSKLTPSHPFARSKSRSKDRYRR
ncbi:unnamed protein product [Rodentolepis nana]|uniref:DUF5737 domain-containing protein n=1 Tax=Rodentolepis nana TaxID=102285 RepID=A0A0R3TL55_RODNA|nr:unnamed protein product [Rodentolepis nana]